MRYINAKHPAICWPLLPWFVEGNQTREEIFMELYGRLENKPQDTFVEVALDGDICKGILIAYLEDDYVWIWQARIAKDFKNARPMLVSLSDWARTRNITELRAGCSKNKARDLFMRRYGFKKDGNEIVKEIA